MQAALCGQRLGVIEGGVEVLAMLDQLGAVALHGAVLFTAVAVWYDNDGGQAVARRRKRYALAVIAARGGDDAGRFRVFTSQLAGVADAAAHLEGPGREVVLVLHQNVAARSLVQQWP